MCSYASPSEEVPAPRAIARSMLSLGIELSRAFWIAVARVALASGSGPPSRAATMIARESLEKSLPRFASAAPFLCLMVDHLLCPDTHRLRDQLEEPFVDPRIVGQLGVERGDEHHAVAQQHRLAVELGQHLDARADVPHARRADEDAAEGPPVAVELEVCLEARDLAAVGIPVDLDVRETEVIAVDEDHPGTGAEDRPPERPDRLVEPVEPRELRDRRRLPAGDDEPVEIVELLGEPDLHHVRAGVAQRARVLPKCPLQG